MNTDITTTQWLWIGATYLIASIPFSLLIGRIFFGLDIRKYGDGNPGATNVKRATGSMGWFLFALSLDTAKGLFPVGIAYWILGWHGLPIVLIAWSAVIGHAFTIFLRFNGGKAIATTVGVWIGLTIMEAPIVMTLLLTYWFLSLDSSDWAVICWWFSYMLYLLLTNVHNPAFLLIWLGMGVILLHRHRQGLKRLPGIKRWLPFLPGDESQGKP